VKLAENYPLFKSPVDTKSTTGFNNQKFKTLLSKFLFHIINKQRLVAFVTLSE